LIGGDLAALGDIRLKHFHQILRRRIAKRHDLRPRSDCRRPNRDIGGRTGAKRHDAVDAVAIAQRRPVLVEQGFECRQQGRTWQRPSHFEGRGSLHAGIDRVIELERRSENYSDDLANIRVDKRKRHVAILAAAAGYRQRHGERFPGRTRLEDGQASAVLAEGAVHPRRRRLQRARRV